MAKDITVKDLLTEQTRLTVHRFALAAERWLTANDEMTRFAAEVRSGTLAAVLMMTIVPGFSERFMDLDVDPMRIAQDVHNSRKGLAEPGSVRLADGIRAALATRLEEEFARLGVEISIPEA